VHGLPSADVRRILAGTRLGLTPEALYRECAMTVLQAVQRFGTANLSPRIKNLYDRGSTKRSSSLQAIEKNDELDANRLDWQGQAVALGLLG
jgi:hypothetical protein